MKFLCTKVKPSWLTSPINRQKVLSCGLHIQDPFIGVEIKSDEPGAQEYDLINNAIDKLFGENKKVFQVRLIDL